MSSRDALTKNLQRVARHDTEAFDALYKATSAKLFGIVVRILRRRELAEEVLQEVYLKIWQQAGAYNPSKGSPITWMAVMARNRALDALRRVRMAGGDDCCDVEEIKSGEMDAFDEAELADDLRRLVDCLEALAHDKRDMVLLAYFEGYSREELSQRFKSPVNTIKTWLHRSLTQLKECLGS